MFMRRRRHGPRASSLGYGEWHLVSGIVALFVGVADLLWQSPASTTNNWDPPEQFAQVNDYLASTTMAYILIAAPATLVFWRFEYAGTLLRGVHIALGIATLGLLSYSSVMNPGDVYGGASWHGSQWRGSHRLVMLSVGAASAGHLLSFYTSVRENFGRFAYSFTETFILVASYVGAWCWGFGSTLFSVGKATVLCVVMSCTDAYDPKIETAPDDDFETSARQTLLSTHDERPCEAIDSNNNASESPDTATNHGSTLDSTTPDTESTNATNATVSNISASTGATTCGDADIIDYAAALGSGASTATNINKIAQVGVNTVSEQADANVGDKRAMDGSNRKVSAMKEGINDHDEIATQGNVNNEAVLSNEGTSIENEIQVDTSGDFQSNLDLEENLQSGTLHSDLNLQSENLQVPLQSDVEHSTNIQVTQPTATLLSRLSNGTQRTYVFCLIARAPIVFGCGAYLLALVVSLSALTASYMVSEPASWCIPSHDSLFEGYVWAGTYEARSQSFSLGNNFEVHWSRENASLRVVDVMNENGYTSAKGKDDVMQGWHDDVRRGWNGDVSVENGLLMWASVPGRPFVQAIAATYGVQDSEMHYGFEWLNPLWVSVSQNITRVEYIQSSNNNDSNTSEPRSSSVRVSGTLAMRLQIPSASIRRRIPYNIFHVPYTFTLSVDYITTASTQVSSKKTKLTSRYGSKDVQQQQQQRQQQQPEAHVRMVVSLDSNAHTLLSTPFVHTFVVHQSSAQEAVYGFGERFTYPNLKGACVPIMAQEQGVGRGQQPLTFFMNRFQDGQGGSWQSTHSAIPTYVTSEGHNFALDNSHVSVFDMTNNGAIATGVLGGNPTLHRPLQENSDESLVASRPAALHARIFRSNNTVSGAVAAMTRFTRTNTVTKQHRTPPPEWLLSGGLVVSVVGGTSAVEDRVLSLQSRGVSVAAVFVMDWTGVRKGTHAREWRDRVWWDWQVDSELYSDWSGMVVRLANKGVRVLVYANPHLTDISNSNIRSCTKSNVAHSMYTEALKMGCLIIKSHGQPYIQTRGESASTGHISSLSCEAPEVNVFGTVDLSQSKCRTWFAKTLNKNILGAHSIPQTGRNASSQNGMNVPRNGGNEQILTKSAARSTTPSTAHATFLSTVQSTFQSTIQSIIQSKSTIQSTTASTSEQSASEQSTTQSQHPYQSLGNIHHSTGNNERSARVAGWFADMGEGVPFDSVLGPQRALLHGWEVHNKFPEWWAMTGNEAANIQHVMGLNIVENKSVDDENKSGDNNNGKIRSVTTSLNNEPVVVLARAASMLSSQYVTAQWLGDQTTTWDRFSGLKSALRGALSASLSGIPFTFSSIGGRTAFHRYPFIMLRSQELLMRWLQLSALLDTVLFADLGSVLPNTAGSRNETSGVNAGFEDVNSANVNAYSADETNGGINGGSRDETSDGVNAGFEDVTRASGTDHANRAEYAHSVHEATGGTNGGSIDEPNYGTPSSFADEATAFVDAGSTDATTIKSDMPRMLMQLWDSDEMLGAVAKWMRVRAIMAPYVQALITEAFDTGMPPIRPMVMHSDSDAGNDHVLNNSNNNKNNRNGEGNNNEKNIRSLNDDKNNNKHKSIENNTKKKKKQSLNNDNNNRNQRTNASEATKNNNNKNNFEQFMIGSDWVVCPAMRDGLTAVDCQLPSHSNGNDWVELCGARDYKGERVPLTGKTELAGCKAPLDRPCILVRVGDSVGQVVVDLEQELCLSVGHMHGGDE